MFEERMKEFQRQLKEHIKKVLPGLKTAVVDLFGQSATHVHVYMKDKNNRYEHIVTREILKGETKAEAYKKASQLAREILDRRQDENGTV